MFHNILVPIDISEPALTQQVVSYVETQASIDNTSIVHFLTVVPTFPYYVSLGLAYSAEIPDQKKLREEAHAQLIEVTKKFNIPEARIKTHVTEGSPKDEILKLADAIDASLIIIASHRPGIETYLLGSNAATVVRHAKCPVLVVR